MESGQYRVLLVEDDYLTRQVFAETLRRDDLDIDVAESLWEARRLIDRWGRDYCCVLLDLHLPDGLGARVADYLRAADLRLPILLVTGDSTEDARLAVAEYSDLVRLLIRKPVDATMLSDMIVALGKVRLPIRSV